MCSSFAHGYKQGASLSQMLEDARGAVQSYVWFTRWGVRGERCKVSVWVDGEHAGLPLLSFDSSKMLHSIIHPFSLPFELISLSFWPRRCFSPMLLAPWGLRRSEPSPGPPWDALWPSMHCCCCSACWSCGPEAWPVGEGQCCCRNHPVTRWSTLSSRTQVSVAHTHNRMSVWIQPITFPISFHNYTNFFLLHVIIYIPSHYINFPFPLPSITLTPHHLNSSINICYSSRGLMCGWYMLPFWTVSSVYC